MNSSLYLSQSYKDAWDDYSRSLRSRVFPVWDYIILTASNEHQAESFRLQVESRKKFISPRTQVAIIPDEGGVRVGSGGATLSVLKWLKENRGYEGKKILVIHSGGDSKRVPQYSALGKLFFRLGGIFFGQVERGRFLDGPVQILASREAGEQERRAIRKGRRALWKRKKADAHAPQAHDRQPQDLRGRASWQGIWGEAGFFCGLLPIFQRAPS